VIGSNTMRFICALVLVAALLAQRSHAAQLNLAAVSCSKYENEILAAAGPAPNADPINTVMWLFGFSVAKSGERAMFGDSLTAFGFALDTECKNNPTSTLLEAVTTVKSKRSNPMDLVGLDCATFETRHVNLSKSDPESANTLTMWLFGYSVGLSGGHVLDADSLDKFDAGLNDRCTQHPQDSLYDALSAPNPAIPGSAATKKPATTKH
jgi:HdeA/HdeB family